VTDDPHLLEVTPEEEGVRLDAFVARHGAIPRAQAEKLAREGKVLVEGKPAKPGLRLEPGLRVQLPILLPVSDVPQPEARPLTLLFEDEHVIVLSKPPGLAVHPGAGRRAGTLVNALLAHAPGLAGGESFRPGIVHRLDRDTSGVMVVAKTPQAFAGLTQQVRTREMERRYLALAWGQIREDRVVIDVPIGRHLTNRTRMAAVPSPTPERTVRAAVTDLRVHARFPLMTLVEARLETGRTHQIRVHLAHLGHPVVGDPVYGQRAAKRFELELDNQARALVAALPGQALHAQTLTFRHPITGQELTFSASPPPEMARLLVYLRASVL
jgi:23S rRNA pseudouridine1911/1915/1917 synthase